MSFYGIPPFFVGVTPINMWAIPALMSGPCWLLVNNHRWIHLGLRHGLRLRGGGHGGGIGAVAAADGIEKAGPLLTPHRLQAA